MTVTPNERQDAILHYLTEQGFATVSALAQEFRVSEMTIRRDLAELEKRRALQRTYGGATVYDPSFFEVSLQAKTTQFVEEKRRIGRAAANLVQDGDIVILDAGSTTMLVAKFLKTKRITVITNALNIAADLSDCPEIEIFIAGGHLRQGVLAIVGPQTAAFFENIRADKMFMGTEGIDVHGGIMVPDFSEAHTKRAMVNSAKELIVVADHTKIGRSKLNMIVPLSKVTMVITGHEAESAQLDELRAHVNVMTV
jgi:DeoR family transcriptional regulator, fructose operon transcriptional repressor